MEKRQLRVAKCTEKELVEVREYLQKLEEVIEDFETDEVIANVARQFPSRTWLVPLNLGILLDNYQDKESDIIAHPKWIEDLYDYIEKLEKALTDIRDWNEDLEEEWEDQGYRAIAALKEAK